MSSLAQGKLITGSKVESKATSDVSPRSRVIPVLVQNSAQLQDDSPMVDVPPTDDVNQATDGVHSDSTAIHLEPQMVNEEAVGNVADSGHTPQADGVHSDSTAVHFEPQVVNEEAVGNVVESGHTPQSSERSLAHGTNNGALEQMNRRQPDQVTDQAVEGSGSVMNQELEKAE
ncbi:hypothetical protein V6N11_051976 [Hibiscus sabdariffa]|uniref:Uncharacterized protein n=1 Tax=Hibiscus sabdariffa TaxID=183260 RepID=A0ABR2U8L7_9ROSI